MIITDMWVSIYIYPLPFVKRFVRFFVFFSKKVQFTITEKGEAKLRFSIIMDKEQGEYDKYQSTVFSWRAFFYKNSKKKHKSFLFSLSPQ